MRLIRVIGVVVGIAVGCLAAAGVGVARYAVLGGRARLLTVGGRPSRDVVRLPRIDASVQPATFGLEDRSGELAVVGRVIAIRATYVDRQIDAGAAVMPGDSVRLVGNIFGPGSALARSATESSWDASGLVHRVWDFEPDGKRDDLRFVHVHGLGASPAGTLRSVDTVRQLGYPSTVVSLDGTPDMFARVRGIRAAALERVTAAIDHARGRGTAGVVLVGWSFGGQLSVQATAGRDDIAGLVLLSPTTDLLGAIRAEARARGIPRFIAELGIAVLTTPGFSHLAAVDRPLGRQLFRSRATAIPLLLMHSDGDRTLSLAHSQTVMSAGLTSTFIEFPASPHTMEWNADPELFTRSLERWIRSVTRSEPDG